MSDHLFPVRLSRRDFVALSATAAAAAAVPRLFAAENKPPVRIGTGKWTYTLDENWGRLPEGMHYGLGCGMVVDSKDRVYVTSRSDSPAWPSSTATAAGGNLGQGFRRQGGLLVGPSGGHRARHLLEQGRGRRVLVFHRERRQEASRASARGFTRPT